MGESGLKSVLSMGKDMLTRPDTLKGIAMTPLVYASSGASLLASALHLYGVSKDAIVDYTMKHPVFREPVGEAVQKYKDRIPQSTILATTQEALDNARRRYPFDPADDTPGLRDTDSWMQHLEVDAPRWMERYVKRDLVNVPQDDQGKVNVPVLLHELGHVKDYAEGKAQQEDEKMYTEALKDLFKGVVNPDDTALGRKEVRAWDNAGIPKGHPMRETALDTYRYVNRYRLIRSILDMV